jgi:hypothetical protein
VPMACQRIITCPPEFDEIHSMTKCKQQHC